MVRFWRERGKRCRKMGNCFVTSYFVFVLEIAAYHLQFSFPSSINYRQQWVSTIINQRLE